LPGCDFVRRFARQAGDDAGNHERTEKPMNRNQAKLMAVAASACIAGAAMMAAYQSKDAGSRDDKRSEIKASELPAEVRAAADKFYDGAAYRAVKRNWGGEGKQFFEVSGTTSDSTDTIVTLTDAGAIVEVRERRPTGSLTSQAMANFKREFPHAEIDRVTAVKRHYFEVDFTQDGHSKQVRLFPNGYTWRVEDTGPTHHQDKDKEKDKDKDAKKKN
jgi:hypothetical protein